MSDNIFQITLLGINFAKFINLLNSEFKNTDGTYNIMDFLNETDCASYCALKTYFNDPDGEINKIIGSTLKTIQVVGGRRKKMGGGGSNLSLVLILILYLLAVACTYDGPEYKAIVAQYKSTDPKNWPEIIPEPTEPKDRFLFYFFNIGKDSGEMATYKQNIEKYKIGQEFKIMRDAYIAAASEDRERKAIMEQTKAETEATSAQAQLTSAVTSMKNAENIATMTQTFDTQNKVISAAIEELSKQSDIVTKLTTQMSSVYQQLEDERWYSRKYKSDSDFYKGVVYTLIAGGGLLGAFYFIMLQNRPRYIEIGGTGYMVQGNQLMPANVPVSELTLRQQMPRGGKTKRHRKKRNTKKNIKLMV